MVNNGPYPSVVTIEHVGGEARECTVVDHGGPRIYIRWDGKNTGLYGVYEVSLNNGSLMGSKLRRKFRLSADDLTRCRDAARGIGVKVNPCGLGGARKSKRQRKTEDARQVKMWEDE